MDEITSVSWLDEWFARHKAGCPWTRMEISVVERYPGQSTRLIMACAACEEFVSGSLRDEDLPRLMALLAPSD